MKNNTALLLAFAAFIVLPVGALGADPKPAAPEVAKPAPADPKIAELQAKVEELTSQLKAQQRATQAVQEQRNAIAGQLLDAQASIRLMQLDAKKSDPAPTP